VKKAASHGYNLPQRVILSRFPAAAHAHGIGREVFTRGARPLMMRQRPSAVTAQGRLVVLFAAVGRPVDPSAE
jgi:hypothetical protein